MIFIWLMFILGLVVKIGALWFSIQHAFEGNYLLAIYLLLIANFTFIRYEGRK